MPAVDVLTIFTNLAPFDSAFPVFFFFFPARRNDGGASGGH